MAQPFESTGNFLSQLGAKRYESALELKMKSKMIEMELESKKRQFDYEKLSPEGTAYLGGLAGGDKGNIYAPGQRIAPTEASQLGMLGRANIAANAHANGVNKRYNKAALVKSVLDNPQIFDSLPAMAKADIFPELQAGGFKYLGKPLGEGLQVKADAANSAIRAVERINARVSVSQNDFLQLYAPGSIGAKELRTDLSEVMDVITRVRTGAALNKDEQTFYRAQLMERGLSSLINDIADGSADGDVIKYQLNTVYLPYLQEMSKLKERRETSLVEPKNKKKKGQEKVDYSKMSDDDIKKSLGL